MIIATSDRFSQQFGVGMFCQERMKTIWYKEQGCAMMSKKIFLIFTVFLISAALSQQAVFAQTSHSVDYGTSAPKDTDQDGLTDQGELTIFSTDPHNPDTDGDGYLDGAEIVLKSDPLDPYDPKNFLAPEETVSEKGLRKESIPWPWYIARVTGILSYVMTFLIISLGILLYTKKIHIVMRSEDALGLHKYLSIGLWAVITVHIFSLLFDEYVEFTIASLFIPFLSSYKSIYVSLGIFAFYLFLVIIISSLYFRMKHRRIWKRLHWLVYPFFALALVHGVMVGSDTSSPYMQYLYWATGITVGLLVVYRIWYGWRRNKTGYRYRVSGIRIENGIAFLELSAPSGEVFSFEPGQYAMLALKDSLGKLTTKHPFSITSSSLDKRKLDFGIKIHEGVTRQISNLKLHDEVFVSGPFGDFCFDRNTQHTILFAGGVGITPFMSMIKYATEAKLNGRLTLYYSAKKVSDATFAYDIIEIAHVNKNFHPTFVITQEGVNDHLKPMFTEGRIDFDFIRKNVKSFQNTKFFICGPAPFVDSISSILKQFGVRRSSIRKELFF